MAADKGDGDRLRRRYQRLTLCEMTVYEPDGEWTNIHACGKLIPTRRRNSWCTECRAEVVQALPKY